MKETGWNPLPTSLKVITIFLGIGILSSVYSLFSGSSFGYSLLGFYISGITGLLLIILINILGVLLFLRGIWKRNSWTWKYGISMFSFFIVNGLLSVRTIPQIIKAINIIPSQQGIPLETVPLIEPLLTVGITIGLIVGTIINIIFLILLYKKRSYFENNRVNIK